MLFITNRSVCGNGGDVVPRVGPLEFRRRPQPPRRCGFSRRGRASHPDPPLPHPIPLGSHAEVRRPWGKPKNPPGGWRRRRGVSRNPDALRRLLFLGAFVTGNVPWVDGLSRIPTRRPPAAVGRKKGEAPRPRRWHRFVKAQAALEESLPWEGADLGSAALTTGEDRRASWRPEERTSDRVWAYETRILPFRGR